MPHFITYEEATGLIVGHSEGTEAPEMPEGYATVEHDPVDPYAFEVVDGVVVARTVPLAPPVPPRTYTFNEWVDRFSFAAQAAIVQAGQADPVAKLIYDRAFSAGLSGSINPQDRRTAEGVQYLVSQGYITQADADGALAP